MDTGKFESAEVNAHAGIARVGLAAAKVSTPTARLRIDQAAVTGKLQRDPLQGVAEFPVRIRARRAGMLAPDVWPNGQASFRMMRGVSHHTSRPGDLGGNSLKAIRQQPPFLNGMLALRPAPISRAANSPRSGS